MGVTSLFSPAHRPLWKTKWWKCEWPHRAPSRPLVGIDEDEAKRRLARQESIALDVFNTFSHSSRKAFQKSLNDYVKRRREQQASTSHTYDTSRQDFRILRTLFSVLPKASAKTLTWKLVVWFDLMLIGNMVHKIEKLVFLAYHPLKGTNESCRFLRRLQLRSTNWWKRTEMKLRSTKISWGKPTCSKSGESI